MYAWYQDGHIVSLCRVCEGPIQRTREGGGGSEWEPIKILFKGDGDSNKTNMTSNTRLRLTTQVGQAHAATGMLLDRNQQTTFRAKTHQHTAETCTACCLCCTGQTDGLHRSDRWIELVRPDGSSSRTTSVPESLNDFSRPWNKNTPKTQPAQNETLHKA
jgi:hypothetical protein